jgi:GT2 family glycosyltransferase
MAYKKSVLNIVGKWDESYFLYYEDADFCERALKKGVSLLYDPSIHLWHKNAQSTGGSGSSLHQKYQTKNRLIFGLKYAPFRTKIHLLLNIFRDFLSNGVR